MPKPPVAGDLNEAFFPAEQGGEAEGRGNGTLAVSDGVTTVTCCAACCAYGHTRFAAGVKACSACCGSCTAAASAAAATVMTAIVVVAVVIIPTTPPINPSPPPFNPVLIHTIDVGSPVSALVLNATDGKLYSFGIFGRIFGQHNQSVVLRGRRFRKRDRDSLRAHELCLGSRY